MIALVCALLGFAAAGIEWAAKHDNNLPISVTGKARR